MRLVMLGPPGSGKGTQAKFISRDNNIPQISTGDLLRAAINKDTEIGRRANEYMNTGNLVPDDIVLQLLKERLTQEDCQAGFILDGYPRNIIQAHDLEKICDIDLVINIDVDQGLIIERITGRRTCKKCEAIFHVKYHQPQREGICDKCGGPLYQREDDTEETVKKRLITYKNETIPLIEYYNQKKKLRTLVSDGTIEDMRQKVTHLLSTTFSF
ncbi:MAG: adenylate kinase [Candidatus Heimdallarchaeota archaeon]|nr:MAG: adenylate kinase [Candidatus Heimdallarchaeota archaeon]